MPGPVFLHFQTYSRKPGPAGNSVAQIIGEALRRPEFSHHVPDPTPPRVVSGDAAGFEEAHAAHIAARATEVRRKGKVHKRAIREDRHTLATAVASYPLTREQIEAGGPEAAVLHREWERRTVEWMRDRYGDQLRVVLAHDDEAHPHLHFWMLPNDPDARADTLHPGKVAKHLAEGVERAAGASDREAVKAGNEALKEAMRGVLDDYWREVGQPVGMTRDGPKRQRLTRAEWQARKADATRVGETLRRARDAEAVVSAAEAKAEAIQQEARLEAGQVIGEATAKAERFAVGVGYLVQQLEAGHLTVGPSGLPKVENPHELIKGGRPAVQAAHILAPAVKKVSDARDAAEADRMEARSLLGALVEVYNAARAAMPRIRQILTWDLASEQEKRQARLDRRRVVGIAPGLRKAIAAAKPLEVLVPTEQPRPEAAPDFEDGRDSLGM